MSAMFARNMSMKNWLLLAVAGIVAGMMACASPQAPDGSESMEDLLFALEVTSDGESTLVTLVGVHEADLEVASHSDPWAISIDLGNVPTGSEMMPMAVYDGTVDQVSAASFTDETGMTSTRVEIALSGEAVHEIVANDEGLSLRIVSHDSGMDGNSDDDIWETQVDPLADIEPLDPFAGAAEQSVPLTLAPPREASTLTGVRTEVVDGGVLVQLIADGVIGATETFTLEDPARLVIDLPGMVSTV